MAKASLDFPREIPVTRLSIPREATDGYSGTTASLTFQVLKPEA